MESIKVLNLDFRGLSNIMQTLKAVQYDDGRAVRVLLSGTEGTISKARVYCQKPSGKETYTEGTVVNDYCVLFELTPQMLAETGIVKAQLQLMDGEHVVTSFDFQIQVSKNRIASSSITSSDEYQALVAALKSMIVFENRLDAMQNIPTGDLATSADAALNDIKIGYDGIQYDTPGEAVRQQFGNIVNGVKELIDDDIYEDVSGNPIVIEDASQGDLNHILVSGATETTEIYACGKNLINFGMNQYNANAVHFVWDNQEGTVTITTDEGGATKNTISSKVADSVNEYGPFYLNQKLKFGNDTLITVSANCQLSSDPDGYQPQSMGAYLQVLDGVTYFEVEESGYTFIAKAGVEYGLRFLVEAGTELLDGIVFKPQVEIGRSRTEFEPYSGTSIVYGSGKSNENIFQINPERKGFESDSGKVKASFDSEKGTITVTCTGATQNQTIYDEFAGNYVNGIIVNHIYKFEFNEDTNIFVGGTLSELADKLQVQATDGTNFYNDTGNGVWFVAKANTEYAVRIIVFKDAVSDSAVIKPIVSTGIYCLKAKNGITTVYANDTTTISFEYKKRNRLEKIDDALTISKSIMTLTGGKITHPLQKLSSKRPMISFIDDDTTSLELVQRYYNILKSYGVVGNYAVMTFRLDENPELVTELLDYEKEGFGMLYHINKQQGAESTSPGAEFLLQYRDMTKAEDNFVTGLRKMRQYGFCNYHYWVSPYGVNDNDMKNLAQRHGMQCLISTGNNACMYYDGNSDRYDIPRYGLATTETGNVSEIKQAIDNCCEAGGWMIVTTHVNAWGSETTIDDRFKEVIEYAINKGMDIVSFPQAFEVMRPVFYLSELL